MINIPAISEWRRIFIDTSFIIDLLRALDKMSHNDLKYQSVYRSQKLLEHFQLISENGNKSVRWVTSSIVLSELIKFENTEVVDELQKILATTEVEIINFTPKEARFILQDMRAYIEEKHVTQYIRELQKELAQAGVFNPRNYVSKDALIIACAKSKKCDVVLTSDKNSFVPLARKVQLPILLSEDIPLDMYDNINSVGVITTKY